MADISLDSKEMLKRYSIFLGIIAILFSLLIFFIISSRKSWNEGLADQVQMVLDEYKPDTYIVGKSLLIKSSFAVSSACFTLNRKDSGNHNGYTVILRIMTLYGPQAGVFIYNSGDVEFTGFACLEGRVGNQLKESLSDNRITYWKKRIPEILRSAEGFENDK